MTTPKFDNYQILFTKTSIYKNPNNLSLLYSLIKLKLLIAYQSTDELAQLLFWFVECQLEGGTEASLP